MKKTNFIIMALILAYSIALPLPSFSAEDSEDVQVGTITTASGKIHTFHRETGRILTAQVGDTVYQGDSVRTKSDSFAEITMKDGSLLKVAPNTRIKISDFLLEDGERKKTIVQLFRGKLRATVSKVKSLSGFLKASFGSTGGNFAVSTPSAVIGVKGTEFLAIHEKGRSSVYVDSGEVEYWNVSNPEESVIVKPGHYSHTVQGSAPTPPMPYTLAHATVNQSRTNEMASTKFSTYGGEDHVKNTRGSKEESGELDVTEDHTGNMLTGDDTRESFETTTSLDNYRTYLEDNVGSIEDLSVESLEAAWWAIETKLATIPPEPQPTLECYSAC